MNNIYIPTAKEQELIQRAEILAYEGKANPQKAIMALGWIRCAIRWTNRRDCFLTALRLLAISIPLWTTRGGKNPARVKEAA